MIKLKTWTSNNNLKINTERTVFMIITHKNKVLENISINCNNCRIQQVEKVKYLELWIDNKLNRNCHISQVQKRIAPIAGTLHKCESMLDT